MPQLYSDHFRENNKSMTSDDEKFCNWMDMVEKYVHNKINFYLLDLEDEMYRMHFEDGFTSREMSNIVIDNFNKAKKFFFM